VKRRKFFKFLGAGATAILFKDKVPEVKEESKKKKIPIQPDNLAYTSAIRFHSGDITWP
jgi:hypothetical protein